MLVVLLTILKILLIVLAVLLGIVLLLVMMVLFVPIRYYAKTKKYESAHAILKVTYLLKIVRAVVTYEDNQLVIKVKVLFFTVYKKIQEFEEKESEEEYPEEMDIDELIEILKEDKSIEEKLASDEEERKKQEASSKKEETKKEEKDTQKSEEQQEEKEKADYLEIAKKFYEFLTKDKNKGVLKYIALHIGKIVKSIMPKKAYGKVKFGLEEPHMTGLAVGAYGILCQFHKNVISLTPDFNKAIIEGEGLVKGRIFVIVLVYNGLKIISDSRVRRLIRLIKEVKKTL